MKDNLFSRLPKVTHNYRGTFLCGRKWPGMAVRGARKGENEPGEALGILFRDEVANLVHVLIVPMWHTVRVVLSDGPGAPAVPRSANHQCALCDSRKIQVLEVFLGKCRGEGEEMIRAIGAEVGREIAAQKGIRHVTLVIDPT